MKYDTLKALVNAKVYENTEQRITGGDMNDVLQSAIASLGAHYQMGGLVSPTDQITVGDEPVVFLATTPGTYTNFGGLVVADGEVALLVWSSTAWSKQTPDIATRTEVSQLGQYSYVPQSYTLGYSNKVYTTSGSVSNLSGCGITRAIPVISGEVYHLVVDGINNSISALTWASASNLPSTGATPLSPYKEDGDYYVSIENDGYLYVSYNLTNGIDTFEKITTVKKQLYDVSQESADNTERIEQLELDVRTPYNIILQKTRLGKAILTSDGSVIDNLSSSICGGVPINKDDILIFSSYDEYYPNVALLGYSETLNNAADSYEVLSIENIGTNLYKYKATEGGYIYIGCQKNGFTPNATIYKLGENVLETYSKKVECRWGTAGYIAPNGSSSSYRIGDVSVITPSINVLAGDIIDVTILSGLNSAAAPIAFNATDPDVKNNASAGYYTPLCEYVAQQTEYHAVAPSDGYIFITFDPNNTTYVTIKRNRTIPDISPIWKGKNWLCIGDSLTNDNKTAKLRYLDYIADETGILPINVGISGSGYKRLQDLDCAFYQQAQKNYTNDIEIVTIFGSFNDTNYSAMGYDSLDEYLGTYDDTGTETLAGCINTAISNIISVNPLARIGIIAPCPWQQTRYVDGSDNNKYVNMLELVAKYNSVPFLNLFTDSGLMPWLSSVRAAAYTGDNGGGVHPDSNGQKMLSAKIRAFMERLLLNI